MNLQKETKIREIVKYHIKKFADNIANKHIKEKNKAKGVINSKINNIFISTLGSEFIFYSSLSRSFDSSFGNTLEDIGDDIAKLNYTNISKEINSFILPAQENKIQELTDWYNTDKAHRVKPDVKHYNTFTCIKPNNIDSYKRVHVFDHCFYKESNDTYYLIELKASGNLDNKKASAEKKALLTEYFLLKNSLEAKGLKSDIKMYFATAYNMYGENKKWKQSSVLNNFSEDELLISKDYWNFICDDKDGYKVVINEYKLCSILINHALDDVKKVYL